MAALAGVLAGSLGCDDPGAALRITDAHASRNPDGRVAVEVDLEAHEAGGRNIGIYCVRVTFTAESPQELPLSVFHEECRTDLRDGDTKTTRLVSDRGDLPEGDPIHIRVRLAATDIGRDLAAPK
jgi:hypothetical protein